MADLRNKLSEANRLLSQKNPAKKVEYVKETPKVIRVKEPPIKEIVYERDPYLIEQNERLARELEESLKQEQSAKLDLSEKIKEIRDLNQII